MYKRKFYLNSVKSTILAVWEITRNTGKVLEVLESLVKELYSVGFRN